MSVDGEHSSDLASDLHHALDVDLLDPEAARSRAAIEARLFGAPYTPPRIGRFVALECLGAGGMGVVYAAYDPSLDRKVAIKLLRHRGAPPVDGDRLAQEARAMARLAHPNVAHVYEVGEHEGRLFLAMEYVRGKTLRAWCLERPRSVAEILAMCRQAGEGLAAAHAAGITHRDFKPDNVIIGDDGRPRVLDFGLAQRMEVTTDTDADTGSDRYSRSRTRAGARTGTPGYMAPEQIRGEIGDPKSDQFAFCVTVWEALVGALPFSGADPTDLLDAVSQGRIEAPPRHRMPAWVERVLRRGLADAPEDEHRGRYASVANLLRALGRDRARLRRRLLGSAAVVGAVAIAFAVGSSAGSTTAAQDPCAHVEEALAAAWPDADRASTLQRLADDEGAYGPIVARRLAATTDDFADRWIEGRRDACIAHRDDEQSDGLFDRRMLCLEKARSAFGSFGTIAAQTEGRDLAKLSIAADALPDPRRCADLDALMAIRQPPPPEAQPIMERLGALGVRLSASLLESTLQDAAAIVADARRLGYGPVVAQALYVQGHAMIQHGELRHEAAEALREAALLALEAGDDTLAVRSWGMRLWALGIGGDATETEARELMTSVAERLSDRAAAVSFYTRLGGGELGQGHRGRAREYYERAVEIGRDIDDPEGELAYAQEGLSLTVDDAQLREALLTEAVDTWIAIHGAEHPRTLDGRELLGMGLQDPDEALAYLAATCHDYAVFHPALLDDITVCERELAIIAEIAGDDEAAAGATSRWADAAQEQEHEDAPTARASVALRRGDAAQAAAILGPIVAGNDAAESEQTPFWKLVRMGDADVVLGKAWRALGDSRASGRLALGLSRLERAAAVQPVLAIRRRVELARRAAASAAD